MEENKTTWNDANKVVSELVQDVQRQSKRWFFAFLITLAALVGTNAAWIYVFNSYEYVYQDGEGENYYNNEVEGDVDNGSTD